MKLSHRLSFGATFRTYAAAAALLAGASLLVLAPPAHAQATGTTNVDITVNPLCILFYYSNVDVTVPASAMSSLITDPDATSVGVTNGVEHFEADEGTEAVSAVLGTDLDATLTAGGSLAAGVDLTALDLNLLNCWAVRCMAAAGGGGPNYNIEIQRGDGVAAPANVDLINGASTITITDTGIRNSGGGGFTAEATAITNPAQGIGNLDTGDCQLTLDLSATTIGDIHSSAAGTDFTITVTAGIP